MERPSDIALDTSSEVADTIDYAATPAAGNTAPHPARNIDLVAKVPLRHGLRRFFASISAPSSHCCRGPAKWTMACYRHAPALRTGLPSVPPARTPRGHG
jgi:hypothetical protein